MLIDRGMDKEDMAHLYNGVLLSHKKKKKKKTGILPFLTTWMDLQGIMLHEISQTREANIV